MRSLFLFLLLGLAHTVWAQSRILNAEWEALPFDENERIDDAVCVASNGIIYCGTGINQAYELSNRWWQFDPTHETWQEMEAIPGMPRQYASAFVHGQYVYVIAGDLGNSAYSNEVLTYDTESRQWLSSSVAPWSGRAAATTFSVGERTYMCGGRNDSLKFSDCWRFDAEIEQWMYEVDMPFQGRDEMISFSHGIYGYVLLGRSSEAVHGDVWKYNTVSGEWYELDAYPGAARSYAAAVTTAHGAVLAGGESADGTLLSEAYYFDGASEEWQELPSLPLGEVRGMSLSYIAGSCFTYGGLTHNFTRIADVQRLDFEEYAPHDYPEFIMYPNPCSSEVYLESNQLHEAVQEVFVQDLQGRVCLREAWTQPKNLKSIEVSGLNAGVYLLSVMLRDGASRSKLIVVQ